MSVSWLPAPLIPPFRFGTVEPEVYRGAYPKQRNLRYLKRLKLRTILSLIPDAPDDVFQEFCAQQGIRSIHLPVDKVKDNVPLTYNRAVEAVQIIIDQENLPIYIHCLDGASVTGLVVCCIRKLQTWNISSAMGEFLRYLRGGVISSEESAFVEKFSSEINISKPIPPWLWEGQITFKKHPTLKLKFTIPPAAASSNILNTSASSPSASSQSTVIVFPTTTPQVDAQTQGVNGGGGSSGGSHSGANGTVVSTVANGASGSSPPADANAVISNVNTGTGGGNSNSSIGSTTGPSSSSMVSSPSSSSSSSPLTPALSGPSAGLSSHASRSSAKNALRDRPSINKSIIRTDISGNTGFGSRATSIATPTTAALARNKRNVVGNSSALGGGQQQAPSLQQIASQDQQSQSDATGGPSPGSTSGSISSGAGGGGGGMNTDPTSVGSHVISIVRGRSGERSTHGGESGSLGGDVDGGTIAAGKEKSEEIASTTTEMSTSQQQQQHQHQQHDRSTSNTPTIVKSSPIAAAAVPEVVDEYYEVSMTLKALALEGADF
ncbi:hypothetical protein BGZ58_000076 [Dissophora ornata]|nr:hypothetical protein BGZ58_000076 [Dissophora ornata]